MTTNARKLAAADTINHSNSCGFHGHEHKPAVYRRTCDCGAVEAADAIEKILRDNSATKETPCQS